MQKILIVEDDAAIVLGLESALQAEATKQLLHERDPTVIGLQKRVSLIC